MTPRSNRVRFVVAPNARWLVSTTHKGVDYVFGHRVEIDPAVVDFWEFGFRWDYEQHLPELASHKEIA